MHIEKGCTITKNNIALKKREGGRELVRVDCYRRTQSPSHKTNQTSFVLHTHAKQELCISARNHFPYAWHFIYIER